MPHGDRTGPRGQGPITGRGVGFCNRYDMAGYADRCASSMGASNLRKPRIAREIERLLGLMGLTTQEIEGRLGMMARGEIPTKTTVKGDETTKVFDERQALEDAARIQGMLIDKHQIQALPGLLIEDSE